MLSEKVLQYYSVMLVDCFSYPGTYITHNASLDTLRGVRPQFLELGYC